MKRLSVLVAMGAIALTAGGASAATHSRRAHVTKTPQAIANSYGNAQRPAAQRPVSQNESLADRFKHPYESEANGHQWYQNPDRVFTTGNYP
jgi:hypothetical protein